MAASSSFKENVNDERGKRTSLRRTRSSSLDKDNLATSSPSTGRSSRKQISRNTSNSSKSPSERRRRTVSRSNSASKKERAKDKAQSRSRSKDESSRARSDSAKRKSYLSKKASEKNGSKGRKASVLGSLGTFLDEESGKPHGTSRSRDAQSVISSASRRRRRSHTPSSASLAGGVAISREELRKQRRASSAGPLDRKLKEKRSSSRRKRDPSKEPRSKDSSSRRRDPSREHTRRSRDPSKPASDRKESSRSASTKRSRSSSVSLRENRSIGTAPKAPSKSQSLGMKRRPSMDVAAKAALSSKAVEENKKPTDLTNQMHMSLSNGADVPPGFPAVAVDSSNRSSDEIIEVSGSGDTKNAAVLDSTARLRERQAMSESMNSVSHTHGTLTAKGGDKTRRSRRRSILGSIQAAETNDIPAHALQDPEERRKSLRATMSERIQSPSKKASMRQTSVGKRSLSPQGRKPAVTDTLDGAEENPSKLEVEGPPTSNQTAQEAEPTSPGPLAERKAAYVVETPKAEAKDKSLWWNLSKVSNNKSSSTPAVKKGSSKSVISAPALAGKISSVFGKARGKKSKSKSEEDIETSNFNQLEASNASLDLDLLTESPSIQKVSNADELFKEEERNTSLREQDDDIVSDASSGYDEKYLNQTEMPSVDDPTRVSWVELPLFDPQQLLMKSTDHDGTNETAELSGHVRQIDESIEESLKAWSAHSVKKKHNPSLQATIGKDQESRKTRGAKDERTIVTTTTNSSDATTKTTNFVPSKKKQAQVETMAKDLGASQDSLTVDQLKNAVPDENGSSGSLSRSSKRSKGSKSSKSSKENKESFKSESSGSVEKSKNRRSSNSKERNKEKSKRRDDSSTPKINRRKSLSHGPESDYRRRSSRASGSSGKQRSTEEKTQGKNDEGTFPLTKRPSLERRTSVRNKEVGEMTPKKSYLNKRKLLKADKAESNQAKKAVNSSLDTFLDRIENAAPITKDDNRSVHSSMQDSERKRRSIHTDKKKKGEKIHSRRIKRFDPKKRSLESALKDLRGMADNSDHDTDGMSVTSAPLLRYKNSASSLLKREDSFRPVVDLKNTQFSSKLSKLHVAF